MNDRIETLETAVLIAAGNHARLVEDAADALAGLRQTEGRLLEATEFNAAQDAEEAEDEKEK